MSLKRDLMRNTTKDQSSPFRRCEIASNNSLASNNALLLSTHTSPRTTSIPLGVANIREVQPSTDKERRISSLQEEFENLKRKIKDVENKNERIIEKIHVSQHIDQRIPQYARRYPTEEIGANHREIMLATTAQDVSPSGARVRRAASRDSKGSIEGGFAQRDEGKHNSQSITKASDLKAKYVELKEALELEQLQKNKYAVQLATLQERMKSQQLIKDVDRNASNETTKHLLMTSLDKLMDFIGSKFMMIEKKQRKCKERIQGAHRQLEIYKNRVKRQRIRTSPQKLSNERSASQAILSKYESLIKSKNEECEGLIERLRCKEREGSELRLALEKIKEERWRSDLSHEELLSKFSSQVKQLTAVNNRLQEDIRMLREPIQTSIRSQQSKISQGRSSQQVGQRIAEMEVALLEKVRINAELERELESSRTKSNDLLSQYRQQLEASKMQLKAKSEETAQAIATLKQDITVKQRTISQFKQKQQQLVQQVVEMQVELNSTNQKLSMKKEFEKLREQQYLNVINRLEQTSSDNEVRRTTDNTSRDKLREVQRSNRELQLQLNSLKQQLANELSISQRKFREYREQLDIREEKIRELLEELDQFKIKDASEWSMIKAEKQVSRISSGSILDQVIRVSPKKDFVLLSSQRSSVGNRLDASINTSLINVQDAERVEEMWQQIAKLKHDLEEANSSLRNRQNEIVMVRMQEQARRRQLEEDVQVLRAEIGIQKEISYEQEKTQQKRKAAALQTQKTQFEEQIRRFESIVSDLKEELERKEAEAKDDYKEYSVQLQSMEQQADLLKCELAVLRDAEKRLVAKNKELERYETLVEKEEVPASSHAGRTSLERGSSVENKLEAAERQKARLSECVKTSENVSLRLMDEFNRLLAEAEQQKTCSIEAVSLSEQQLEDQRSTIEYLRQLLENNRCSRCQSDETNSKQPKTTLFLSREESVRLIEQTDKVVSNLKQTVEQKDAVIYELEELVSQLRNSNSSLSSHSIIVSPGDQQKSAKKLCASEEEIKMMSQNLHILMEELRLCQIECRRKNSLKDYYKTELYRMNSAFFQMKEKFNSLSKTVGTNNPAVVLHISKQIASNIGILLRHQHKFDMERQFRKLQQALGIKRQVKDDEKK